MSVVIPDEQARVSGSVFRQRFLESVQARLAGEGVATEVDLHRDYVSISTLRGEVLRAKYVVAAPFGTEMEASPSLGLADYYGRGVSNDAAADASFFSNADVVVWGAGYRAAEQALIAAEFAASVSIVSGDAAEFHDP